MTEIASFFFFLFAFVGISSSDSGSGKISSDSGSGQRWLQVFFHRQKTATLYSSLVLGRSATIDSSSTQGKENKKESSYIIFKTLLSVIIYTMKL